MLTHVQVTSTRPVTTAHLAQTMTLLSLPIDELAEQIETELSNNPALEMLEERRCPTCHRPLPDKGVCPICSRPTNVNPEEPVVFISTREDFFPQGEVSSEDYPDEPISPSVEDLPTFVMRQIATELADNDRGVAAYLLTHLNEDGLLTTTLFDAASYLHISPSRIQEVQSIIKRAEPIGVGSLTPQEALLAQLEVLGETEIIPELAAPIVRDHFDLLTRHHFSDLAKIYNTSQRQIQKVAEFISDNLNPFPARSHWGNIRQPGLSNEQVYRQPDIIINHMNEDPDQRLMVEIIIPLRGTLRVNPLFKAAISETEEQTKEEMKTDLDRASLFVKCLQQRNHTMLRLMQRVVSLQKGYILMGDKNLKPVTRVQLSKELDVHESTISRAVANKSVQLPNRRIIPLSSFFDRSLNVRTVIKEMINNENRPLSDSDIVALLTKQGFNVARRTVAKYRAMEGILPAHLRHLN